MTILITRGEVIQCVKQELELAGIVEKKHAAQSQTITTKISFSYLS